MLHAVLICPRSSEEDKQTANDLILEFRKVKRKSKAKKVRKYFKPNGKEIDFGATTLLKFLKWDVLKKQKKTPPPLYQNLTDIEVKSLLFSKNHGLIPKLLCHSQHNERCVQYTTKTIAKVVHAANQKADLILCQNSRDEYPTELSKTDFRNARKKLKF